MDGWGWATSIFVTLFGVALLGLIVWAIKESIERRHGLDRGGSRQSESPREILDRRLARGEIDVEGYERALEALTRPAHEPAARPR